MAHKTMLKFKVWNNDSKKFIEGWEKLQEYFHSFCNSPKDKQQLGLSFWREPDGYFTICRFTGLKDKQGNEIYEGDIVKFIKLVRKEGTTFKEATGKNWKNAYDEKIRLGKIGWDEEEAKFYPIGEGFCDYMGKLFSWKDLEVIGNIYEHSHLLKGGK